LSDQPCGLRSCGDRNGISRGTRAMQAMLQMVKLDIAGLQKAYDGG
jgi:hypothetical protein